jgi:hypothetical protein
VLAIGPLAAAAWALDAENDVIGFVAAAVAGLAFYIGLTFSGVAIASATAEVIAGRDAKVTASVGAASRRLGPILGWAVVGTLVSLAFLLSLLPLMLVIAGIVEAARYGPNVLGVTAAIIGLLALAAIGFLGRAASATFGAIVYRYATTGEIPETIPRDDLEKLARPASTPSTR